MIRYLHVGWSAPRASSTLAHCIQPTKYLFEIFSRWDFRLTRDGMKRQYSRVDLRRYCEVLALGLERCGSNVEISSFEAKITCKLWPVLCRGGNIKTAVYGLKKYEYFKLTWYRVDWQRPLWWRGCWSHVARVGAFWDAALRVAEHEIEPARLSNGEERQSSNMFAS